MQPRVCSTPGCPTIHRGTGKVARHVPTPFVRVDLYEAQDGPVFGEITPIPAGGTSQFVPEWDERLGRLWDRAVA